MTTPPERTNKLAPRWKGPFLVKRVSNAYQVTYEADMVWRTVHVNHVKPAKTPAAASPSLCHHLPHHHRLLCTLEEFHVEKASQTSSTSRPYRGSPQPAAPVAEPTQPAAAPSAASPPPSRPTTCSSANENSAPRSELRSPATPERTNENSWLSQPLRRSARLKSSAMCIK